MPTMYQNPAIVTRNSMSDPAPRNRTMTCTPEELLELSEAILRVEKTVDRQDIDCQLIGGDFFEIAAHLPARFIDWKTSSLVLPVLEERFFVRNRITWEREKGRGAKRNWKNNTEDIWFCTNSEDYCFDVDAVKLKRKVLAPYRVKGEPKDWKQESDGNYRLTHPSNMWTDLTVPFWSMPENTPHPAQKPEKLFAKLVLASSKENDFVFDPFLGSGTSAVVAEKLGRQRCGIDINTEYLCWARNAFALHDANRASKAIAMVCSGSEIHSLSNERRLLRKGKKKTLPKARFSNEVELLLSWTP